MIYSILILVEALTPLQETVTVPLPFGEFASICQVQETNPLLLAYWLTNPAALLSVPAGLKYRIEQIALGLVSTDTLALFPGAAPFTLVKVMVVVGVGAIVVVGEGEGLPGVLVPGVPVAGVIVPGVFVGWGNKAGPAAGQF